MKTKLILLILLSVIVLTLASYAAIPHLINFQGKATDTNGAPLNGTYNLTFKIYDHATAGNLEWQETHQNLAMINGIFGVLLGSVTALNLPFDEDYWITIEVNTDGEMTPRTRLASVGYAYKSEMADYATSAGTAEALDTNEAIDAKGGLIIENRTSDPANPVTGQLWLRTDI